MYTMGSLNCSGVGRKVGQSVSPKGRSFGFDGVLRGFGVLTEDMSSVGETRIEGPSRNLTRMPASVEVVSSCSLWLLRAAMASVLDLRGARLDSEP